MTTTRAQSMEALERANGVRLKRAVLRRKIKAGERTVTSVLRRIPPYAETMTLGRLLRAQRGWGRHRTREFCSRLVIAEERLLCDLTTRQRQLIRLELALGPPSRRAR